MDKRFIRLNGWLNAGYGNNTCGKRQAAGDIRPLRRHVGIRGKVE
jgi:hypothetical protein